MRLGHISANCRSTSQRVRCASTPTASPHCQLHCHRSPLWAPTVSPTARSHCGPPLPAPLPPRVTFALAPDPAAAAPRHPPHPLAARPRGRGWQWGLTVGAHSVRVGSGAHSGASQCESWQWGWQWAEDRNHFLSACGIFSPLSDILALWSPHCHEFRSVNFTDLIPEFPTS